MRRAKDGVAEPVFYQGQVVGETRRYSDTLAMFILKSKRREVWGERREIDFKHDWSNLTEAERVRKAMAMLDMAQEIVARGPVLDLKPSPLVYDPTDGDELAEQERRRRQGQQQQDDNNQPGGIAR